jgi:outer membrane protein TolC
MMLHARVTLLICLLACAGTWAEETDHRPLAPDLDLMIQQALSQAPVLAVAHARVETARARTGAAAALPDPSLELAGPPMGISPLGDASTMMLEVGQGFPFPGKRAARRATAEAELAVSEMELKTMQAHVVEALRISYAGLYAADQEWEALTLAGEWLFLAEGAVSASIASGQTDRAALLRLRVQAAELRQWKAGVTAERAGLLADLNLLLGQPADQDLGVVHALPVLDLAPWDSLAAWLDANPEQRVKAAEVQVAVYRQEESRLDLRPDFMVGAGGGLSAMSDPVIMLKLGSTLPLWRNKKQGPLLLAARHEQEAAEAAAGAARAQALADLRRWQAEWQRTREVVREYRDSILPLRESTTEAGLSTYTNRGADFAGLIDDILQRIDARTGLARAESEQMIAWARIQRLCPEPEFQRDERKTP